MEFIRIDSLLNLSKEESTADERGLLELIENGYEEDMAEMFGCCCKKVADGEFFDYQMEVVKDINEQDVTEVKTVRMSVWMRGRLYDSDDVQAYNIKGKEGLFVVENEEAEWAV